MSTTRDLEHAAELLLRVLLSVNDGLISRIVDCQNGHPGAGRWDLERSSGIPFCWTHQCDLRMCHQEGWGCLADDIVGTMSDPAGDAATRTDIAAGDRRNFDRAVRRICTDVGLIASIAESYPPTRAASAYERELAAANEPQCELCARWRDDRNKPYWAAPMLNGSGNAYKTTRGDLLDEPMFICQWCDRHLGAKGCPPNETETRDHHEKGKAKCFHPDKVIDAA